MSSDRLPLEGYVTIAPLTIMSYDNFVTVHLFISISLPLERTTSFEFIV